MAQFPAYISKSRILIFSVVALVFGCTKENENKVRHKVLFVRVGWMGSFAMIFFFPKTVKVLQTCSSSHPVCNSLLHV